MSESVSDDPSELILDNIVVRLPAVITADVTRVLTQSVADISGD